MNLEMNRLRDIEQDRSAILGVNLILEEKPTSYIEAFLRGYEVANDPEEIIKTTENALEMMEAWDVKHENIELTKVKTKQVIILLKEMLELSLWETACT